MAVLTYTYPSTGSSTLANQDRASEVDRLFGRDIYFDVANELGANTQTTAAGDWMLCEEEVALRQAILRRIMTNPGEWQALPGYGVGARLFVKAKNTPAARAELEERIRGQLSQDSRIEKVERVVVEFITAGLKIAVVVTPKGRALRNRPLTASVQVT